MYRYFDGRCVFPRGWLYDQLKIQAEGQFGNLDRIWPDVRDSAWIGGSCEGWERVPYWLDGFIPLAFLLRDEGLLSRAQKYIDAIVSRQQEDGWLCPCSREERAQYDIWSAFLIGKVLAMYCELTGDMRVEDALRRAMKNLFDLLSAGEIHLESWGRYRWFEALIPLLYLYEKKNEAWIPALAQLLEALGTDYPSLRESWKTPINRWTFDTHVVNIAMMLKYPALLSALLGRREEGTAEMLWQLLTEYNGTAVGTLTGDECLAGISNVQGTELCSVVELMYSFEWLFAVTGDSVWLDRLEKAAFNALPATLSDDMWTHQYDQQVNQIACVTFPGKSFFRTNPSDAGLFGLEPCFGCCTANGGQGWPKLALSLYAHSGDDDIFCALALPSQLRAVLHGVPVTVTCDSEYPFRLSARYTIRCEQPCEFSLSLRVPGWAEGAVVDGQEYRGVSSVALRRIWQGETAVNITYLASPRKVSRPHGLFAVEYGPLVFALNLPADWVMQEYERKGVERRFPYCDYELYPRTKDAWQRGFSGSDMTVVEHRGDSVPFSSVSPRITLRTHTAQVAWDYADGYETVAAKAPAGREALDAPEETELFPYGCAKLRMTEMPQLLPPRI